MKKTVTRNLDDYLSLDGPLEDVIKGLQDIKEKYSDRQNLRIFEDSCYEGGNNYYLHCDGLETDEEERRRIEAEQSWAARQLEQEKLQYEKLKEKFGNT